MLNIPVTVPLSTMITICVHIAIIYSYNFIIMYCRFSRRLSSVFSKKQVFRKLLCQQQLPIVYWKCRIRANRIRLVGTLLYLSRFRLVYYAFRKGIFQLSFTMFKKGSLIIMFLHTHVCTLYYSSYYCLRVTFNF